VLSIAVVGFWLWGCFFDCRACCRWMLLVFGCGALVVDCLCRMSLALSIDGAQLCLLISPPARIYVLAISESTLDLTYSAKVIDIDVFIYVNYILWVSLYLSPSKHLQSAARPLHEKMFFWVKYTV